MRGFEATGQWLWTLNRNTTTIINASELYRPRLSTHPHPLVESGFLGMKKLNNIHTSTSSDRIRILGNEKGGQKIKLVTALTYCTVFKHLPAPSLCTTSIHPHPLTMIQKRDCGEWKRCPKTKLSTVLSYCIKKYIYISFSYCTVFWHLSTWKISFGSKSWAVFLKNYPTSIH